jgi:3,5-epimerase/4-reductase
MKVLVTGSNGYLGQQFLALYPGSVGTADDIADPAAMRAAITAAKPDVLINCAGKTGRPNIDWCEDHKEETVRGNVTGPLVLLDECARANVHFVHLGSGCTYAGTKGSDGYTEEDIPNFTGSFYSKTKIWSEQVLREFPVLILRLRMPFDGTTSSRSLLMKVAKYSRVLDSQNSVTYLPDFFKAAQVLISRRRTGIYNMVNDGLLSPYQAMLQYKKLVNPTHTFERLEAEQMGEVAKTGRSNCHLSNQKLKSEGITVRHVDEVLTEALEQLASVKRAR